MSAKWRGQMNRGIGDRSLQNCPPSQGRGEKWLRGGTARLPITTFGAVALCSRPAPEIASTTRKPDPTEPAPAVRSASIKEFSPDVIFRPVEANLGKRCSRATRQPKLHPYAWESNMTQPLSWEDLDRRTIQRRGVDAVIWVCPPAISDRLRLNAC